METLYVGFIGVGGMGQYHLKQVSRLPGVKVPAVCDVNADLAQAMGTQYGAQAYTDHHEMLEKERLDALYVVVPPYAHTDAEIIAARKGIHLFVEKPVALTLEKALEIEQAVREAGIITSVGYVLRYYETATRMRQHLSGRDLALVSVYRWGGVPGVPWWGLMSRSGGQIVEQTTHQVDLVRYMTGKEITQVYADYDLRILPRTPYWDIPDVYSVAMRLEDGTPVSLTSTCTLRRGGEAGIRFFIEDYWVDVTATRIRTYPDTIIGLDGEYKEEMDIDRAFIEAVRLRDPSLVRCDYSDAVRTLAVTLAANQSARTGKPVTLRRPLR